MANHLAIQMTPLVSVHMTKLGLASLNTKRLLHTIISLLQIALLKEHDPQLTANQTCSQFARLHLLRSPQSF